ncbi:hypothetical protein N7520_004496 [Penicillium odoratum]|uniref:uncharacterized protein n=1 Tax=Penicillium odoratum TaxID=1167516 RepID=UPI002548ECC7|nr:uncharacterized protein N7520_004496 [Penicillium odoratum]KAJ5764937.1 hypothetical protein N7520_004496 [Penicillium odoratum]
MSEACRHEYIRSRKLLQSSFPPNIFQTSHISASEHAFVCAVFCAYSDHHHLTIRPEDVWFSILTQLGFFVNRHAEELRSFFVTHEGQREIEVIDAGDFGDFGALALLMTRMMEKNLVDEELRTWVMPEFTTTTESDRVVAAVLMMGSVQKYFTYRVRTSCGIPSVTLLGERKDWILLLEKLEKIYQLGDEPARFAQLLRPVLNHFVASFDNPNSPEVLNFWSGSCHERHFGSGTAYLGGWISVFCFWDADGKLLHQETMHPNHSRDFEARNTDLGLDDAVSRRVNMDDIPTGFSAVPVTVEENGHQYDTMVVAGLVGIQATSSEVASIPSIHENNGDSSGEFRLDSIQPLSGWWMCETERQETVEQLSSEIQNVEDDIPRNVVSNVQADFGMEAVNRPDELTAF